MPVSEATFKRIALEDPDGNWEYVCGRLRSKPAMTMGHNNAGFEVAFALRSQLDPREYRVRSDAGRLRNPDGSYYIPDVVVIPVALTAQFRSHPEQLEAYSDPVALVVEVWSPSTGDYDIEAKLPNYQRRGDFEIWLVHPVNRTITVWTRRADGAYRETVHRGGKVTATSLPGVTVDFDALFTLTE